MSMEWWASKILVVGVAMMMLGLAVAAGYGYSVEARASRRRRRIREAVSYWRQPGKREALRAAREAGLEREEPPRGPSDPPAAA